MVEHREKGSQAWSGSGAVALWSLHSDARLLGVPSGSRSEAWPDGDPERASTGIGLPQ